MNNPRLFNFRSGIDGSASPPLEGSETHNLSSWDDWEMRLDPQLEQVYPGFEVSFKGWPTPTSFNGTQPTFANKDAYIYPGATRFRTEEFQWYIYGSNNPDYKRLLQCYVDHGYWYFDYEKALKTRSALSQLVNVEKFETLFGTGMTGAEFRLADTYVHYKRLKTAEDRDAEDKEESGPFVLNTPLPQYVTGDSIPKEHFAFEFSMKNTWFFPPERQNSPHLPDGMTFDLEDYWYGSREIDPHGCIINYYYGSRHPDLGGNEQDEFERDHNNSYLMFDDPMQTPRDPNGRPLKPWNALRAENPRDIDGFHELFGETQESRRYRLMTFEFEKYKTFMTPWELDQQDCKFDSSTKDDKKRFHETRRFMFWEFNVYIQDGTHRLYQELMEIYRIIDELLELYSLAAAEPCAFDEASGFFTSIFINGVNEMYLSAESPMDPPWVSAPFYYEFMLDLLFNTHDGEMALIEKAAADQSALIGPTTGSPTAIARFLDGWKILWEYYIGNQTPDRFYPPADMYSPGAKFFHHYYGQRGVNYCRKFGPDLQTSGFHDFPSGINHPDVSTRTSKYTYLHYKIDDESYELEDPWWIDQEPEFSAFGGEKEEAGLVATPGPWSTEFADVSGEEPIWVWSQENAAWSKRQHDIINMAVNQYQDMSQYYSSYDLYTEGRTWNIFSMLPTWVTEDMSKEQIAEMELMREAQKDQLASLLDQMVNTAIAEQSSTSQEDLVKSLKSQSELLSEAVIHLTKLMEIALGGQSNDNQTAAGDPIYIQENRRLTEEEKYALTDSERKEYNAWLTTFEPGNTIHENS